MHRLIIIEDQRNLTEISKGTDEDQLNDGWMIGKAAYIGEENLLGWG